MHLLQSFCKFVFRAVIDPAAEIVEDFNTTTTADGEDIGKTETGLISIIQILELGKFLSATLIQTGTGLFTAGLHGQLALHRQFPGKVRVGA